MYLLAIISHLPAVMGSGAGVWLLTEAAKKSQSLPIWKGQTLRLRAVAGVLSALSAVALGLANGNLSGESLGAVITSILGLVGSAAGAWAVAHGVHLAAKPEQE